MPHIKLSWKIKIFQVLKSFGAFLTKKLIFKKNFISNLGFSGTFLYFDMSHKLLEKYFFNSSKAFEAFFTQKKNY